MFQCRRAIIGDQVGRQIVFRLGLVGNDLVDMRHVQEIAVQHQVEHAPQERREEGGHLVPALVRRVNLPLREFDVVILGECREEYEMSEAIDGVFGPLETQGRDEVLARNLIVLTHPEDAVEHRGDTRHEADEHEHEVPGWHLELKELGDRKDLLKNVQREDEEEPDLDREAKAAARLLNGVWYVSVAYHVLL